MPKVNDCLKLSELGPDDLLSTGHDDVCPLKKITPLHRDPKQQELRIHLRTRFGLGPEKLKNALVLLLRPSPKMDEKALVLLGLRQKKLKKHWFY